MFSFSEFMQELLTFVLILSISSTCLCRGLVEDTSGGFNVLYYGAVGDGQTDDSQVYELVSEHFIYFFVFAFYFLIYAFKELKGEEGILVSLLWTNNNYMNVKAFLKAWTALCQTKGTPQLIVPSGKKFLLMPVMFQGPCQSNSVQVQV